MFVHQDLGLIPNLSVAENFAISQRYNTGIVSRIRWRDVRKRAVEVLGRLNHADIDIDSPVSRLPVATQTIVAIARALSSAEAGARVLVLDEPTAALPDDEAERLFAAVRHIVASGVAVLYVSHKLQEILVLADRATVLRDGRKIDTVECAGLRERDLVQLIVGREVEIPNVWSECPRTRLSSRSPTCGATGSRMCPSRCTRARSWAWSGCSVRVEASWRG